ncbi:hypothetical protein [Polaromonas sp. CG9_12]|nr:hypothetical protein [Polaromonas sp. CG9_12]
MPWNVKSEGSTLWLKFFGELAGQALALSLPISIRLFISKMCWFG